MKTTKAGIAFIAAHEGVRLRAYPDPGTGGAPWTIGIGHTSAAGPPHVVPGMTITRAEADAILARDLLVFEETVIGATHVEMAPHEFDALVSLCLNIGPANFRRSTLLRRLNAGDKVAAAAQFALWNQAAGRVMPGLVRRRADERRLFERADYGLDADDAPAPQATPASPAPKPPPASPPVIAAKPPDPIPVLPAPPPIQPPPGGFFARLWAGLTALSKQQG